MALKPCLDFDVNIEEQGLMAVELKRRFPVECLEQNGNAVLLLRSLVWEIICLIERNEEKREILFSSLWLSLYNYLEKQCFNLGCIENSLSSLKPSEYKFRSTLKKLISEVNTNVTSGEVVTCNHFRRRNHSLPKLVSKLPIDNELLSKCESKSVLEASRYHKEFVNLGIIEKGGFGTVCKVIHLLDGCIYALKVVPFRYKSLVTFQKILKEVQVFANISSHPNIIQYKTSWLEECVFEREQHVTSTHSKFETLDEKTEESDKYVVFADPNSGDIKLSSGHFGNYSNSLFRKPSSDCEHILSFESKPTMSTQLKYNGAILYIQMELCAKSLKLWIEERNNSVFASSSKNDSFALLNVEEPLQIFRDILKGVAHIHDSNLIHRDIKPQNILFSFDGTVKIADFGLSTFHIYHSELETVGDDCGDYSPNFAEHTIGLGTSAYAAPEQKRSAHYDRKVDIYSLGFVLLELVYPFATSMEKAVCFEALTNKHTLPESLLRSFPKISKNIIEMTSSVASSRPDAKQVLASMQFMSREQKLISELQEKVQLLTSELNKKDDQISSLKAALQHIRDRQSENNCSTIAQCQNCSRNLTN